MHLLDTDTLTHLHAGHSRVAEHLRTLTDKVVGTTIINRVEILRGRFEFLLKASNGSEILKAQERLKRSEELLGRLLIVPFDDNAIGHFERLRRMKGLKKVGRADLLVASIALAHHAILVTRNLRHFQKISGLECVNWVD